MLRIYALNLLLLPVNLGGVLKSLEQAATGKRIPFGRTPKVSGRTGMPALYVLAEYGLVALCLALLFDDFHSQRWNSAVFHLGNGLILVYAIGSFVGLRASLDDLRAGVLRWVGTWLPKAAASGFDSPIPMAGLEPRQVPVPIQVSKSA